MVNIRQADPTDSKRIAEIQVNGWKVAYRGILPDSYLDRLDPVPRVPVWDRFIRVEPGQMFVAQTEAGVIGFCHLIPSRDPDADDTSEIAAIYIEPSHWRKGYGRMLCGAAFASSEEQGFQRLTLWVLRENTRGRCFYEEIGFRLDGATKTEERPGFILNEVRYRMEHKQREQDVTPNA